MAQEAFADLHLLHTYLNAMKGLGHISFDLSLARGLDYYTGTFMGWAEAVMLCIGVFVLIF